MFVVWYSDASLKVKYTSLYELTKLALKPLDVGNIKRVTKAKVAVFTCGLDIAQTETKGTVLIKNAEEMLNFTTGEEKHLEKASLCPPVL